MLTLALRTLIADLTGARLVLRRWQSRPGRRRLLLAMAVAAAAVAGATLAAAEDGKGVTNPFIAAFTVTDTHGITGAQYAISVDSGGTFDANKKFNSMLLTLGWDQYRLLVSLVLWLFDWALQFKILDILIPPAQVLATTLQQVIDAVGLQGLLLTAAAVTAIIWIQSGKTAAGLTELVISLCAAALLGSVLANPVARISGPDGLIQTSRDLGVGLSAQIVTAGKATSGAPEQLEAHTTAVLADTFIRMPHQLLNYGAVIDANPTCVATYDAVIKDGPYPEDSTTARDRMGECDPAYKTAAETPAQGVTGLVILGVGGLFLMLLVFGFVLVLSLLVAAVLWEGAKFCLALLKAIVPGTAREDLGVALATMFVGALGIIATIAAVGIFTVTVGALFAQSRGWNPIATFAVLDLLIVLGLVGLLLGWLRARRAGKKLGQRLSRKLSPGPAAVDTRARPQPLRAVTQHAGSYLATKKAIGPAGRAPTAAHPGPGRPGGTTPATPGQPGAAPRGRTGPLSAAGAGARLATKGAWTATKVGLAATVGLPVAAPRAYGAARTALAARDAALRGRMHAARQATAQRATKKVGEVKAYGAEYAHNVEVAAHAVGKVSGAAKAGQLAVALGAGPAAAGVAAGAMYAAASTRPRPAPNEESVQHGPARPGPAAAPPVRRTPSGGTATPGTQAPPGSGPGPGGQVAAAGPATPTHLPAAARAVSDREAYRQQVLAGLRARSDARRRPAPTPSRR